MINVLTCEPDELIGRGTFRCTAFDLTERLGAAWIGATVYEVEDGVPRGTFHYHEGVEEWMYVVSGAPVLRDRAGERELRAGDLVAHASGPAGVHSVIGPGRVVIFSVGARGWGESFVTVYPDSDKIAAAPGVMFRRADALAAWTGEPPERRLRPRPPTGRHRTGVALAARRESVAPTVNVLSLELPPAQDERSSARAGASAVPLGGRLDARTWQPTLHELAPGTPAAPYRYEWCREEWLLMLDGTATLRSPAGVTELLAGDIACFPQGPDGAHQLVGGDEGSARLLTFATPVNRPRSVFYPDDDTVEIRVSDTAGFRFRLDDQIEDYWDGEPGAGPPPA